VRTVRSFANEDYERARYSEKVDITLQLGLRQAVRFSQLGSQIYLKSKSLSHGY
jgi:hypothetical protein